MTPRHAPILRALQDLQRRHGFLPREELERLSRDRRVPLHRLHGLATFYPSFRLTPGPKLAVGICRDLPCLLRGCAQRLDEARRASTALGGEVEVKDVPCLGLCERAPAAVVGNVPVGPLAPGDVEDLCRRALAGRIEPEIPPPSARFQIDPYSSSSDRYGAFLAARKHGDRRRVIADLKESGLRGMGGAGFPAGLKWETVAHAEGPTKVVIVNADESEPGTFKDRFLLEHFPHLVLEGMLLGAWAVGAEEAIVYIRHEYAPQAREIERAIDDLDDRGIADGIHIELFESPGGYICGEETALLEALEDKRAEPRNKPPFPATHGLHQRPTLIHNVETFAWVPSILLRGPEWYKKGGVNGSHGAKIVGISGDVRRPGVYEVPLGKRLIDIVHEEGCGVAEGAKLKAILPGGASSAFLPASAAELPYDFAPLAKAGTMLGSGAIVVVSEGREMLELAANATRFFRDESCGKCVPCRLGTEKVAHMLDEWTARPKAPRDRALVEELGRAMARTSICGLGQAALNPLLSAMKHFPGEA